MATWLPLAGIEGAVIDGVAPESGPIVTAACASGRDAEHPAIKSTPVASIAGCFRNRAIGIMNSQGCGTVANR
ncbi:hypothetical protein MSTO_28260 [Mycobacterium stomatepiae]|uniref:Uncharacterized protein n=1 Tax=Mycobacterium stomatepiae TaxID=470076 RepID=A0A7I7Q900_9MYCO|nr:hypothetical protein MSTO_28260 [Mycobacterium stomatepiae]